MSDMIKSILINSRILESNFLDSNRYSFFLTKNNGNLYSYRKMYQQLRVLIYILKKVHHQKGLIIFLGLTDTDYVNSGSFNNILKNLVIKKGHIYGDSKFNGILYNRWSLYKRRSNPSDFFLNLQKNNKLPVILISFSQETDSAILREFSKFGIPIFFVLEGSSHLEFKDYPILGSYSNKMLNLYLTILKYSLK
jgi:hypothetical protein